MGSMELSAYYTAQSVNFKVYTWFGFWKINGENKFFRFSYVVYSYSVIFMMSLYTFLQIVDIKDSWGNVEELSINLSATVTSIFSLCKVYNFKFRMDRIQQLRKEFRNFLSVPGIGVSNEDRQIFETDAKSYLKLTKMYYVLVGLTVSSWWVLPMMQDSLPIRWWMPFKVEKHSGTYTAVYFCQCCIMAYFAVVVITMDVIFVCFISLVCAHFKVLEKNILKYREVSCRGGEAAEQLNDFRAVAEVDSIFRMTNLIHLIGVGILISVTEYDLIQKTSTMNLQFVQQVGNLCSAFFDLFVYSNYGSRLQDKSLQIANAVYNSRWLSLDPVTRKNFMLIMVRSQKKASMTAGKLFHINLETYLSILSTSYNLLAVLRQTK